MQPDTTDPAARGSHQGPKSLSRRRSCLDTGRMQHDAGTTTTCDRDDLDRCDCLELLASQQVGHLGITAKALPIVRPVRYRVIGRSLVFATDRGPELSSARNHAVACVEVADIDPVSGMEWTVLATGRLREIDDPSLTRPGERPLPRAWGVSDAAHFVALDIELLSGCASRSA